jgi:hypothetical protein
MAYLSGDRSENEIEKLREELQRLQHQQCQTLSEYKRDLVALTEQKSV